MSDIIEGIKSYREFEVVVIRVNVTACFSFNN